LHKEIFVVESGRGQAGTPMTVKAMRLALVTGPAFPSRDQTAMLLNEIIDLLSDERSSLTAALLKTKVLLHQMGKKELADWINHELNGYPGKAMLPEYRKLPALVMGNVSNIVSRVSSHPIPTWHLPQNMRADFETAHLDQSLSILEDFVAQEGSHIDRQLPMELNGVLNKGLSNDFKVERAWCQTATHDVKGILFQVRSRLLDFILEMKDKVGDVSDGEELKKKASSFDAAGLFNNAIFGSNTTILVGHHNSQLIQNEALKNDLASLEHSLSSLGIPQDEITKLRSAISEDQTEKGGPSFEGKTGSWFTSLMGRAAKGSLDVGVDVVASAVSKLLGSFIGTGG
jgi:hypothetical protein